MEEKNVEVQEEQSETKFSKYKLKLKLTELKWKAKEKAIQAKNWCVKNKEAVTTAVVVGGPIVVGAIREIAKASRANAEQRRAELITYDRRTDCYLTLKRPLKPEEQMKLARRMEAGEGKTEILLDMGVLKY